MLDFKAAMRLTAVAVTPVIVLRTFIWFGPWEPAWFVRWPVAVAITLAYLGFGVRAATEGSITEASVGVPAPPQ